MKKASVPLLLALVLCASVLSVSAAEVGRFIESPSAVEAPEVVAYENEDPRCTAEVSVTSYADRASLDDDVREAMEAMYQDIKYMDGSTGLGTILEELSDEKKVRFEDLAISDLFDIGYHNCDSHEAEEHGWFTIELEPAALKSFVGLLSFNGEKWVILEAEVSEEGNTVRFRAKELTPLAIVVESKPPTGDNSGLALWMMLISGSAFVIVLVAMKKRKA